MPAGHLPSPATYLLGALIATLTSCGGGLGAGGGGWQTINDYGRWTLDADRQTVRTERQGLVGCPSGARAVIQERSDAEWLIRFEVDVPAGDRDAACPLATGSENELWAGGFELRLAEPVPVGVTARAVCQPEATAYATTVPGGARPTLGPTADGAEPVICSPVPEP